MTRAEEFITRSPLLTARTADMSGLYSNPRAAIRRLSAARKVHRLARGYYCAVPLGVDKFAWKPTIEAAAGGIATSIYGERVPVVMGVTAARIHHAIPRALAIGEVAVPRQHRRIELTDRKGQIRFVKRNVVLLDAILMPTELGQVLVTTVEQTALDLARGDTGRQDNVDTIRALIAMGSSQKMAKIAQRQRLVSALKRAEAL